MAILAVIDEIECFSNASALTTVGQTATKDSGQRGGFQTNLSNPLHADFSAQSEVWLRFQLGDIGGTSTSNSIVALSNISTGKDSLRVFQTASSTYPNLRFQYNSSGTTYTTLAEINYWQAGEIADFVVYWKRGASGVLRVWVNGTKVVDLSGAYNTPDTEFDRLIFRGTSTSTSTSVMTIGAAVIVADEPLHGVRVDHISPDGAGTYSEWTGAYADVDDAAQAPYWDTSTEISTNTSGARFSASYESMDTLDASREVKAVSLAARGVKEVGTAPPTLQFFARLDGADYNLKTLSFGASALNGQQILAVDPADAAWTESTVNSVEFGVIASALVTPDVDWSYTLEIRPGAVASDLTNFPLYIRLNNMPSGFWSSVRSDGADIRASVGGTQVPVDLVSINTGTEDGHLFVKVPLVDADALTEIELYGDGLSDAEDPTATYGYRNVWSDYEAVYLFDGRTLDRTGNGFTLTTVVGGPTYEVLDLACGGGVDATAAEVSMRTSGLTGGTVVTVGVTGSITDISGTTNRAFFGLNAGSYGSDTGRMGLGFRNTTGDHFSMWDKSNSWNELAAVESGVLNRFMVQWNGSTDRRVFRNGVTEAVDTSVSAIGASSTNFSVGDSITAESRLTGKVGFVYIRYEAMTANWARAEYDMLNYPFVRLQDATSVAPDTTVITIASGQAASTLTNFPYYIDLSTMPEEFWHNVKDDGGDIRCYDGSDADLAFDVVNFNPGTRTGALFVNTDVSDSSDTTIKVEVGYPARSALSAGDTYGQHATWAEYTAVYLFDGDLTDRTANGFDLTTKTGSAYYDPRAFDGVGALSTVVEAFQASVDNAITPSGTFTMAASVIRHVQTGQNQGVVAFCNTYGSTSQRSVLGHRDANANFTTYSANNSWLDSGVDATTSLSARIAAVYVGSTERRMYVDGVEEAVDPGITAQTHDTFVVGGGSSSGAYWRGLIGFAYLRLEDVGTDWLEFEALNLSGGVSVTVT